MLFRSRLLLVCIAILLPWSGYADVCVWRNPERTMQRLFPTGRDYKTITVKMTPELVQAVEKAFGGALEESEKKEFNFYDITGAGEQGTEKLGTVVALAGKGKYGAIEIVIAIDETRTITGAYIQRSRERANKLLRSDAFLAQFAGKSVDNAYDYGAELIGADEAPVPVEAVRSTIKKMSAFYRVLYPGEQKEKQNEE